MLKSLKKLFSAKPEDQNVNDPFYMASMVATAIDGLFADEDLETLKSQDWYVILFNDGNVAISATKSPLIGANKMLDSVNINQLPEFETLINRYQAHRSTDSPVIHMATDQLAYAVLRKINKKVQS